MQYVFISIYLPEPIKTLLTEVIFYQAVFDLSISY
jgi:hypothetical protein